MTRVFRSALLVLVVALVAAACGDDTPAVQPSTTAPGVTSTSGAGGALSGSVRVSGSSTVEPITALLAEKFKAEQPSVAVSVEGPGTGDGFKLLCNGETDISDASRVISDIEAQSCQGKNIEFIELKVAVDGLSVIAHPSFTESCLSFGDLYAIFGPESEGRTAWADITAFAAETSGTIANPPPGDAVITAPGEESGTYDSFIEIALADIADGRGADNGSLRADYQSSPNDNVIIEGVAGNTGGIGFVGYSFATSGAGRVKLVGIEKAEGEGCTEPTPETIAAAEFPIARSLYIYVNKAKAEQSPALAAFVDFYISADGLAAVTEAKYVDLAAADIEKTKDTWESRKTGKNV